MSEERPATLRSPSVLVVDDTSANLQLLSQMLKEQGYRARPVPGGKLALRAALNDPPDLILLDINMPDMDGYEVCRRLKANAKLESIPVIFISALNEPMDKMTAFAVGGVDYVTKPFHFEEVRARVETHVKLHRLQIELQNRNRELNDLVQEQVKEISASQMATIIALAKLAESRDDNTGSHIMRVQTYCKVLARQLSHHRNFASHVDPNYIENLFLTAPLHDIGKVGIPDPILLKPGKLTSDEGAIMKMHTVIGSDTLEAVLRSYPGNRFIKMGMGIARSHHERWDGSGNPDGLKGEDIPLSARILAIADQYDALRNARPYKVPFDHEKTFEIITVGDGRTMPEHFDPLVLEAFKESRDEFERVFAGFLEIGK
jgi:putative two-component system response regulator